MFQNKNPRSIKQLSRIHPETEEDLEVKIEQLQDSLVEIFHEKYPKGRPISFWERLTGIRSQ